MMTTMMMETRRRMRVKATTRRSRQSSARPTCLKMKRSPPQMEVLPRTKQSLKSLRSLTCRLLKAPPTLSPRRNTANKLCSTGTPIHPRSPQTPPSRFLLRLRRPTKAQRSPPGSLGRNPRLSSKPRKSVTLRRPTAYRHSPVPERHGARRGRGRKRCWKTPKRQNS